MKKIYIICTAAAVIASSAHAVTDRTYKTKGDMTEEEISLVMDMREILEDTDVAIFSARNKLSNAILASTIGTVLEASALATGIVKNVQQSKAEIKASAELEKLTDEELSARFKAQFIKDCESDKKKNPNSYKAEKEDGTKEDITCQSLEGNFHKSKEIEANKEAMLSYLTEATASDDKKAQAFNWIRMGASAGGAIAGVVSVSVM
ncbi:MAG: hypothetical protein LBF28_03240, partial [Rickettsiales bacterium]|nr:hypothetical protein [Rickettsiales bacterium]